MKLNKHIGKQKDFEVSYDEAPSDIMDVINWLLEVKQQGATHIIWSGTTDYDGICDCVEAQAIMEYEESEQERIERETAEIMKKQLHQDIERQKQWNEYQRLKQQFESDK